VVHRHFTVDHAAAGRYDVVSHIEASNDSFFYCAKGEMAAFIDDLLKGFPLVGLDPNIRVDKAHPEDFGKDHACGALARPWHSDKGDVGFQRRCPAF
jgi:hypothetical protein